MRALRTDYEQCDGCSHTGPVAEIYPDLWFCADCLRQALDAVREL